MLYSGAHYMTEFDTQNVGILSSVVHTTQLCYLVSCLIAQSKTETFLAPRLATDIPKSASLSSPFSLISKFCGFRSRWRIFLL